MTVLRKSFFIHWSSGRSPRVHEVNPGRDPSRREDELVNLTSTSSIIPLGCFSDRSTSLRVTVVGLASHSPNLLKMDRGIMLMLGSRSHNAISKTALPMVQGMVKLP